jgi:REP element-mobilizing transposase RayT
MPSTYYNLNVHVIFSTKNRHPFLGTEQLDEIHRYLGGTIRELGCHPIRVGGIADHVHLLFGFKPVQSVAEIVREVKKSSTKWIRSDLGIKDFAWQEGYAALSVSRERLEVVEKYVANQAEHHRKKSFREELVELLRFAHIEFDERFLD